MGSYRNPHLSTGLNLVASFSLPLPCEVPRGKDPVWSASALHRQQGTAAAQYLGQIRGPWVVVRGKLRTNQKESHQASRVKKNSIKAVQDVTHKL